MLKLNKEIVKDLFPNIEKKRFDLITEMKPSGDQIAAIKELRNGLEKKEGERVGGCLSQSLRRDKSLPLQ